MRISRSYGNAAVWIVKNGLQPKRGVISITAYVPSLRYYSEKTFYRFPMPDAFAQSTARLKQLVREIIKETEPVRYDTLAEEIWRVLAERERLAQHGELASKTDKAKAA